MSSNNQYKENHFQNEKSSHQIKNTNSTKNPNTDDIKKIRDKLENLSPTQIIEDILKNHRSNVVNEKQNLSRFNQNFLENLKQNEISNYVATTKDKSIKEIITEFETRLENYNSKTLIYCLEKEKENKECQSLMNIYKTKNTELEAKFYETERENKTLVQKIKESELLINNLQTKFKIFERIKPTLDEFFKEYPYSSPSEIIIDIKEKRDASVKILEDLNTMRARVLKAEKEKRESVDTSKKTIEELLFRINELESKHKEEIYKQTAEINQINSQMNSYKIYKEENIKLHNMLYTLYNKLITRLSMDKNIKIDRKFLLEEKDFQPSLFDNEEIAQYITLMLNNSEEKKSSQMFRETAAYANMMLRITGKDVKSRFDPLTTFKEIKKELENANDEKNKYKMNLNILEVKIEKLESDLRKLQNELKYKNIQYANLEEKFNKKFKDRLETKKELKNIEIRTRRDSRVGSANNFRNVANTNIKDEENIVLKREIKKNTSKSLKASNSIDITNGCNNVFLTSDNIFMTEKEKRIANKNSKSTTEKVNLSRNLKSATSRPNTQRMIYIRPRTSCNFLKYSSQFQENKFDGENFKSELNNEFSNFSDNKIIQEKDLVNDTSKIKNISGHLKKLKISKNNDKLIKADPIDKINQGALQSLIENTNKLFLYRTRMKMVINDSKENENIFTKFHNKIQNNLKMLKTIKKQRGQKKQVLSDKILDNIDGLIKNLEN